MRVERRALRVLLAGAALVGLAWLVAPVPSPPLYDGLIGQAESYRYLTPPPGHNQAGPPTSASTSLAVSGGSSQAGYIATTEMPPQAQLIVAAGALAVPSGAASAALSITAVPPPAPVPASVGRLDGNVYEITATAAGASLALKGGGVTPPTVVLRGPVGNAAGGAIAIYAGGSWQTLHSVPIGSTSDTLAASVTRLGDFAIVLPGAAGPGNGGGGVGGIGGSGGGFPVVAVVVPIAVLLAIAALLVALRGTRTPAARPPTRRRR